MTRYVSATVTVYSRVKSKKDLKQAVAEGFNAEVQINDPLGVGTGIMGILEVPEGMTLVVTNHPKRSWFANITRRNGKVVVS